MSTKWYAGVGSRKTPLSIQEGMRSYAKNMVKQGWVLRSGGAIGADTAFATGAIKAGGQVEIFTPNDATEEAIELASKFHPAWHKCSPWVRKAHGRNAMIVLGYSLKAHCKHVVLWAPIEREMISGKPINVIGGTGMAYRIAKAYDIPVWCMSPYDLERI